MDNNEEDKIYGLIEAAMFLKGEEGLRSSEAKDLLNLSTADTRKHLKNFVKYYNNEKSIGLEAQELNDLFRFATKKDHFETLTEYFTIEKTKKLSKAAMETLGIIAYKQPVTKSQISEIRGSSSDAVVNTLLIKGMIEEKGFLPSPGQPVIYGITDKFYSYFKISSLKELPDMSEFNFSEGIEEDFDLFSSQRQD